MKVLVLLLTLIFAVSVRAVASQAEKEDANDAAGVFFAGTAELPGAVNPSSEAGGTGSRTRALACVGVRGRCNRNSQCCSNLCRRGRCRKSFCRGSGGRCSRDQNCCGQLKCLRGRCGRIRRRNRCRRNGRFCRRNRQCCSDRCVRRTCRR